MDHQLSRRTFLAGSAGIAVSAHARAAAPAKIRRTHALKEGDRVAIVTPAGYADDQASVDAAAAKVRSLGLEPVIGANILARYGYLAGTDEERASDLNDAIRDRSIRGILCLRGGYGAMRILPKLDYRAFKADPKVIMGYSDITALHLAFYRQSGVITFHGPCAESTWSEFARSTWPIVGANEPFGEMRQPVSGPTRSALVSGKGRGRLVGGNLSLVAALAGTPYGAELRDAVVFLEDIGEDPYRVDRMLTQLILTGGLAKAKGILFGNFRKRSNQPETPSDAGAFTMEQVLAERCQSIQVPSMMGFSFGHVADNHIMPLGVMTEIDTEALSVRFLEPAVEA